MDIAIFSMDGLQFLFRWIHFLSGVTWIGLLYYFNFVQGEWFKEIDAGVKNVAVSKLVPRALNWFRWTAMGTFVTGILILAMRGHEGGLEIFKTSWGIAILIGATLGTFMFLNVWLVIWPNQKIVIASTQAVLAGGTANPNVAVAAGKAGLASRHNVVFSIPLLFFMGAASHLPFGVAENFNCTALTLSLALVIGALQFNALKGKLGPMTTVRGAIHCGLALTVVLYALVEVIL